MAADPLLTAPLRYFLAVAEAGSFTGGAKALRMGQPALTAAMGALERELGTRLFVRTARGVRLTRTGEELVVHARELHRRAGELRHAISDLEGEPRGRLVLGCHESLGAYFLPGLLRRFLPAHAGIELSLWNGNSRDVMDAVVARVVDVGVVVNPEPHPDCVIVPLFGDRVEILAHRSLLRRAPAPALPLVLVPVLLQTRWILERLPPELAGRRRLGCSSMELVKSLVLEGAGLGILPRRVAGHGVHRGALVTVPGSPGYDDRIALVRRADLHLTRAARLFLEAVRARGRELARGGGERGARRVGT